MGGAIKRHRIADHGKRCGGGDGVAHGRGGVVGVGRSSKGIGGTRNHKDRVFDTGCATRLGQGRIVGQQVGIEQKLSQRSLVAVVGVDDGVKVKAKIHTRDITAAGIHGDDRLGVPIGNGLQVSQGLGGIVGLGIAIDRLLPADLVGAGAGRLPVAVNAEGLHSDFAGVGAHAGGGHSGINHAHDVIGRG